MSETLSLWNKVSRPPANVLKQIKGGRLNGKSNIAPQWRYQVLTEQFGPCGIGWKFTIDKLWTETASGDEVFAFALVSLYIKVDGAWSEPIPGIGGHLMIVKETKGLHNNDECFKMATTDAIGVAAKMLGVAADVYMGDWDGSKYIEREKDDPLAVTLASLNKLKQDWFAANKEELEGKDRNQIKLAFSQWIGETTGEEFRYDDFRDWTPEWMSLCQAALKQ